MIVPQYPYPVLGGLERQSHELSKQLIRQGVEVHVISGMLPLNRHDFESVEGVSVVRLPWSDNKVYRFMGSWWSLARSMFKLRSQYDVVHVHNVSWFGAITILISKLLSKPVISKLPNVRETGIPGMRGRRFGWLLVGIFKRSDAIIAMSWESIQELQQINFPDSRTFKMTNGIMAEQFVLPEANSRRLDARLTVTYCGRLDKLKGLADLVMVWPSVLKIIDRPCVLRLYGSGPFKDELDGLIADSGMQDKIEMMGHVNDVAEILHQSDLFVLPSFEEGNSNAILEAMAAGLSIVSTRVGGTPMLVGDAGRDYLVNPGDRDGLLRCLADLLKDDVKRSALGRAMRNRINAHFKMEIVAHQYMQAYDLLIEGERDRIATISAPVFAAYSGADEKSGATN